MEPVVFVLSAHKPFFLSLARRKSKNSAKTFDMSLAFFNVRRRGITCKKKILHQKINESAFYYVALHG